MVTTLKQDLDNLNEEIENFFNKHDNGLDYINAKIKINVGKNGQFYSISYRKIDSSFLDLVRGIFRKNK